MHGSDDVIFSLCGGPPELSGLRRLNRNPSFDSDGVPAWGGTVVSANGELALDTVLLQLGRNSAHCQLLVTKGDLAQLVVFRGDAEALADLEDGTGLEFVSQEGDELFDWRETSFGFRKLVQGV